MSHSPLCTRLNLWKATRRESPSSLKSRIREDCLRTLKENRLAVFDHRRKYGNLGLTFDNERRKLEAAINKENEPMQFDDLLRLYDEVTAELAATSVEQLDEYMNELAAVASLEDQIVCPFCIKGEISIRDSQFHCSTCSVHFPVKSGLLSLTEFNDVFAKAVELHSVTSSQNKRPCNGPISFSYDNDDYPTALLCCSNCDIVVPVF